jgi:hypothetical protein
MLVMALARGEPSVSAIEWSPSATELLDSVGGPRSHVRFRRPLPVTCGIDNGVCFCEQADLLSIGYGATSDEARDELARDISFRWQYIAAEADDQLTADARDLKSVLQNLVAAVSV